MAVDEGSIRRKKLVVCFYAAGECLLARRRRVLLDMDAIPQTHAQENMPIRHIYFLMQIEVSVCICPPCLNHFALCLPSLCMVCHQGLLRVVKGKLK